MSLDITLTAVVSTEIFEANITHNLSGMAEEAGIYMHLWCPQELGIRFAGNLVGPLTKGLELMKSDPARFEALNPSNGWGSYELFVPWIEEYLANCIDYPGAVIRVSR